jgi:glucose-1-phosphatase
MAVKIVFDIGNVLCYAYTHWKDALVASQLDYVQSELFERRLYDLPEYLPYESGRVSQDEYLGALVREFGLKSQDEALHLHRSILGKEVTGVLELIQNLHQDGHQTATLSNNNPIHWEWFTISGPFPAVQSIQHPLSSHLLGSHKPEPEIYELFCKKTGWESGDIVFFDDVLANVEAGQAAGWTAHHINASGNILAQLQAYLQ